MSINWTVEKHSILPSTQDALREQALGKPEGFVIQAAQQSAGRGRHGREWVSPPGNLYVSVLLKPDCAAAQTGQVSFVAALAVAGAVEKFSKEDLFLKWPNDVFLGGKKCAGVLIESEIEDGKVKFLLLGIGVNIASAPPEGSVVGGVDPDAFRDEMLAQLGRYYALWRAEGFAPIREGWLMRAHPADTKIVVKSGSNVVEGRFRDIDAEGNLLLLDAGRNIRRISAGDVLLIGT